MTRCWVHPKWNWIKLETLFKHCAPKNCKKQNKNKTCGSFSSTQTSRSTVINGLILYCTTLWKSIDFNRNNATFVNRNICFNLLYFILIDSSWQPMVKLVCNNTTSRILSRSTHTVELIYYSVRAGIWNNSYTRPGSQYTAHAQFDDRTGVTKSSRSSFSQMLYISLLSQLSLSPFIIPFYIATILLPTVSTL